MELYPTVRVDFPPHQTLFRVATKNLWDVLFEPFSEAFLESEPRDTIVTYPHPTYTNAWAGDTYFRRDGWRFRLHNQFSRLRIKKEVLELADSILPGHIEGCIGVLFRGESMLAAEQRTKVIPSPEAMCTQINKISRDAPVFVCADSIEANEQFRALLGERMLFWADGDRSEKIGQGGHLTGKYGDEHLKRTLAMVLALSRTRHFVHAISNMATAVLYVNPWLPHRFVETPPTKA
jgi:hypothetical protein